MASSVLEKKYQQQRDAAVAEALERFPGSKPIVSFGDHDCIVDVLIPGEPSHRFVYVEED
jgi:hypothetical protein